MLSLIGHGGILRELQALAMSAEPHALLFARADGTGRMLAIEYARLLNGEVL